MLNILRWFTVDFQIYILDGLDYTKLDKSYSSVERKPAVESKIKFKILTTTYSQNIYSSRRIEKAYIYKFKMVTWGWEITREC